MIPNDKSLLDNPCPSHVLKSTLVSPVGFRKKKKKLYQSGVFFSGVSCNSSLSKSLTIRLTYSCDDSHDKKIKSMIRTLVKRSSRNFELLCVLLCIAFKISNISTTRYTFPTRSIKTKVSNSLDEPYNRTRSRCFLRVVFFMRAHFPNSGWPPPF